MSSRSIIDRLLDEAPFVDALARALAGPDADDVVQRTWLQAVGRDPATIRRPRQWLASVVRGVASTLHRASARRRDHERAASRRDLAPSSVELLELQERRRELVDAVDALPEPQRVVVLLRYFEDLPPRRIAEHLDVPVTTVTSRLRAAIGALRKRLDDRHGDRKAWLLPILPANAASAAVGAGVLAMTTGTKVAAVTGVSLLTVLALWTSGVWPGSSPHSPGGPTEPPPLTAEASREPGSQPPGLARDRLATTTPSGASTSGELVVDVTYREDGAPVTDLLVVAWQQGADPRFGGRRVLTDEHGRADFGDLAPGRWIAMGSRNHQSVAGEVVAGAATELRLEFPVATDVTGVVVDKDGLPVAGAHVYMMFPVDMDAERVAITGADGRFDLRACLSPCFFGARAVGYTASRTQLIMQNSGRKSVRIVLPGPGGSVAGTVLGSDGAPVRGAVVVVGEQLPNRVSSGERMSTYGRTGADGRFEIAGVNAGEHRVRVRASGSLPWQGSCRVDAHVVTELQVTLSPGVSCTGVVVDASGAPVPRAMIEVGDVEEFEHWRSSSAADGGFRLDGLPDGGVELRASRSGVGKAATVVSGAPGETVTCTLRLDAGVELRGRVLTVAGVPVPEVFVTAVDNDDGYQFTTAHTDADGQFVLTRCPEGPLTLIVRGRAIRDARIEHVDPGAGPVEVRVEALPPPSVHIKGTVLDHERRPVAHAAVRAYGPDSDRSGASCETSESGAFELGPLAPGEWLLEVDAATQPDFQTDRRRLAAESVWDLREIHLSRGGAVRVRLVGDVGSQPRLLVGDSTLSRWASVSWMGEVLRSEPVAPGPHFVLVRGEGVASQLIPVDVRAGEESEVEVRVETGHRQRFVFVAPAPMNELHLRVVRNDEIVAETRYRTTAQRPVPNTWGRWLAPGEYAITAAGDGLVGQVRFRVREGDNEVVRLVMR